MAGFLLNGVVGWIAERILDILLWLLALLASRFFITPDVTVFPQLQSLASRSSVIVNACFGLVVIVAGLIAMTHGSVQIRYAVKDLVPRLAFAFVASNFGVQACSVLIVAANAVTRAMVGEPASGPKLIQFARRQLLADTKPGLLLFKVIIVVIIVILFLQLLLTWFFRIATLLVLAGLAPIAMACYALPQTQPAAQLWWRSLLGCLAVPILQAVAFSAGTDLIFDPSHTMSALLEIPRAGEVFELFNLFLVVCLLMLTVRIPRMVARYTAQNPPMSTVGLVVRTVLVQSVARRVPGVRRALR